MKKILIIFSLVFFILVLFLYNGCKKSSECTFTVILGEDVYGYPESGTYSYPEGEWVDYSYTSKNGYTIIVQVDLIMTNLSGSVLMAEDHTLRVTSTEFNINGDWNLEICSVPEEEGDIYFCEYFDIIFYGDTHNGDVLIEKEKYGTYSVDWKNVSFSFSSVYYTGNFTAKHNMSGKSNDGTRTWTANRYYEY